MIKRFDYFISYAHENGYGNGFFRLKRRITKYDDIIVIEEEQETHNIFEY